LIRWAVAVLAVLAGCATRPPADVQTPWTSGRLSVRVEAAVGRPAQNLSASFDLRGSGERGELLLTSPLGTLMASARWAPDLAELTTPEGTTSFDTLDALSQQALGESLPLAALPDWLAGRPWAGAASQPTDTGFEQLGWQVSLARRAEGWVEARRAAPPAVTVRAKLDEPS
jgi:outer membrane lipoprotein LolB